jgi:hypothetical protein
VAFEEGRDIGVGRLIGKYASYKAIAEGLTVGREALGSAETVPFESIGENRQVVSLESLADGLDFVWSDFDAGRVVEWQ